MPTFDGSADSTNDAGGQFQHQPPPPPVQPAAHQVASSVGVQQNSPGKEPDPQPVAVVAQIPPLTSPSTDQLSEKIASVKKVWDMHHHHQNNMMLVEDSLVNFLG